MAAEGGAGKHSDQPAGWPALWQCCGWMCWALGCQLAGLPTNCVMWQLPANCILSHPACSGDHGLAGHHLLAPTACSIAPPHPTIPPAAPTHPPTYCFHCTCPPTAVEILGSQDITFADCKFGINWADTLGGAIQLTGANVFLERCQFYQVRLLATAQPRTTGAVMCWRDVDCCQVPCGGWLAGARRASSAPPHLTALLLALCLTSLPCCRPCACPHCPAAGPVPAALLRAEPGCQRRRGRPGPQLQAVCPGHQFHGEPGQPLGPRHLRGLARGQLK